MKHEEDSIQKALFQWIRLATPRIPQLALAFHCPNGGRRDAREAARLKGLGVRAGVPDVMIPGKSADGNFYGIAIELKSAKGRLTDEQLGWSVRLRSVGWRCGVCHSFDEARQTIADYFGVKP